MGGFELSAAEYDLRVEYDVEGGLHGFETLKSKLKHQLRFLREPEPEAGKSYRAKLRVKDKDNPRKPLAQDKATGERGG